MNQPIGVNKDRKTKFQSWAGQLVSYPPAGECPPNVDDRLYQNLKGAVRGSHGKLSDLKKLREFVARLEIEPPRPRDLTNLEDFTNFDKLAWYVSFHDGPYWGIFVREAGIVRIGDALREFSRRSHSECDFMAFKALYLHEYAHFLVDVGVTMLQQISDQDLRTSYHDLRKPPPGWSRTEEALCNAFAIRNLGDKILSAALQKILVGAPEGYRDFGRFLAPTAFTDGVQEVFGEITSGAGLAATVSRGTQLLFDDTSQLVSPLDVPLYLVPEPRDDESVYYFLSALGTIRETKKFGKQLSKAPHNVRRDWERKKPGLEQDIQTTGGNFKQLSGNLRGQFRQTLEQGWRVILENMDGEWWAISITAHDDAYRSN